MDCIFCKMAKKEIETEMLHETDTLFAIRDINPQSPAHFLVIPKEAL